MNLQPSSILLLLLLLLSSCPPLPPTVCVFKIDATIRNAFPKCICGATPPQTRRLLPKIGRLLPRIWKFFPKNRKASSKERLVRTHKFPKHGAASLTYIPRLRLDLPRSRLGLPRLRLSRNSGPATEGLSNRSINFKDAYCTPPLPPTILSYSLHSPLNPPVVCMS